MINFVFKTRSIKKPYLFQIRASYSYGVSYAFRNHSKAIISKISTSKLMIEISNILRRLLNLSELSEYVGSVPLPIPMVQTAEDMRSVIEGNGSNFRPSVSRFFHIEHASIKPNGQRKSWQVKIRTYYRVCIIQNSFFEVIQFRTCYRKTITVLALRFVYGVYT